MSTRRVVYRLRRLSMAALDDAEAQGIRDAFYLMRLLEDAGWKGMRHDTEIQEALRVAQADRLAEPTGSLDEIRTAQLDEHALAAQGYGHERLDQLVTELLLGAR